MNKQELIKKYKRLEGVWDAPGAEIARQIFLQDLEQLDEPQKPVVPQFVADFISEQKKQGHTLSYSIDASMSDRVAEWYWGNSELFARAWLDGYEIEKERRYTVVMKGTKQPLFYNNLHERLFFSLGELATRFTRKQIEDAGLGEVFNSPLFEVEEVE
jgi:hypothetical protein|nr:MAG TPA: Protein of unknown function (DUF1642) [Caudoviricetes sp.]DAV01667.1 MAG TPA: Protein of unknown function (DUF1642) [Caudoviricetes sp.]